MNHHLILKFPKKHFLTGLKAVLPKLDYSYSDLEPVLPENLLKLHHTKHHQGYIDNYNKNIEEFTTAKEQGNLPKIVALTKDIKFNGGSHINHSIYWKNLSPVNKYGGKFPEKGSQLMQLIRKEWGSPEKLMSDFTENLMKIQGSGWGNLVYCNNTKTLCYIETKDQDPVALMPGKTPLLCIDGWEHAWYPKYLNEKKRYYTEIWKIINWKDVESRLSTLSKNI